MVGEGEEADACTSDFGAYWEDNAALAGGVLLLEPLAGSLWARQNEGVRGVTAVLGALS